MHIKPVNVTMASAYNWAELFKWLQKADSVQLHILILKRDFSHPANLHISLGSDCITVLHLPTSAELLMVAFIVQTRNEVSEFTTLTKLTNPLCLRLRYSSLLSNSD